MKIITWNVFIYNFRIRQLVDYAVSHDADVICFQEFPEAMLGYLTTKGYALTYAYDFISRRRGNTGLICTLTKQPPVHSRTVKYSHIHNRSLYNRLYYRFITRTTEQHMAPIVTVSTEFGNVQVVNARLSCAVNTHERLEEMKMILSHLNHAEPAILAGDFNIVDNRLFNIVTGWMRGYRFREYFVNERREFETLVERHKYRNIFRKRSTYFMSYPVVQYDHILVPDSFHVRYHRVEKRLYGSDHRMLLADIGLPGSVAG